MLGPHLTLDMYGCNKDKLNSEKLIYKILDELPDIINMHKISKPQIIKYPGKEGSFDRGGCSGFVLIAESYISIHTFVDQRHASVDIFSCKNFDTNKAVDYLIDKFNPIKVEKNLIQRGKEFPKDVSKVKQLVAIQRSNLS